MINRLLFCGFLMLAIQAAEREDTSVNLTAKYRYQSIVLLCEIRKTGDENFSTYLRCPFGTNQICYKNCEPACSTDRCIPMISKCSTSRNQNKLIRIEWTVDLTKVNKTGMWQCGYGSIYSNSISVEKQTPFLNKESTNKVYTMSSVTETKKTNSINIETITEIPRKISPVIHPKNELDQEENNGFWVFITNPNVVLILVCVFTVSLLFNIIFLVRCALLRSLIDQYIQSNKISDSCLYRCFCIRINDGLPPVSIKSIPQSNPGNTFIGYHREDVYDDMSASSQAERHLISNYSQYEMEQESLLARKFWNPDGSQTVLGRQSQFYSGPPMNNYVIVSGPVCSNRTHAPFLPPSSASILNNSQRTCITDEMAQSSSQDSHKNESSVCNDSIIYSQPVKNRPKSIGQFTDGGGDTTKMADNGPPAPPIRTCTESQCYRTPTPCIDNMQPAMTMKNVDLIEHCTHSTGKNSAQENIF